MTLVLNEVRLLDTALGVARLRLQVCEDGQISLRAEPEKGERDETIALAAIRLIHEHARAMELNHRALARRYREGQQSSDFVDVVDAIDLIDGEKARQLLGHLHHLLNAKVH